jgi:hypothetical protein
LIEYALAEVNYGGSLGNVLADVIWVHLGSVGWWVLHVVSSAPDAVKWP